MDKVARIEIRNNKKNNKGFEIITLKSFFESSNASVIGKQFRTNFYNLIYVTQGKYIHEIDFLEYTIRAGELLIGSSNRVNKYSEFENVEGYLIMFTEGFLCEFLSNNSSEVKDLFSQTYLNPQLKYLDVHASIFTKLLDVIHYSYMNMNSIMNYEVIASSFRTLAQLIINIKLAEETLKKKK